MQKVNTGRKQLKATFGERNMKKVLTTILSGALLVGTAQSALAFTPESEKPIKLMVADWTSMLVNTEITNIILSTYGYNIEKLLQMTLLVTPDLNSVIFILQWKLGKQPKKPL